MQPGGVLSMSGRKAVGRVTPDVGRALLLCGYPKSGTTLLQSLLDGHPDVLVIPEETKYFARLHRFPWRRRASYLLRRTRIARFDPKVEGIYDLDYVDWSDFQRELRARLPVLPRQREVLPAIAGAYARASGLPQTEWSYWVEKTPGNERHLASARAMWPELRALYLVRDPRDVFTSFRIKRGQRGKGLAVGAFCAAWRASLVAWDDFVTASPVDAHCVTYESLVEDPEAELKRLCAFLEIEDSASLRRPTVGSRAWGGNSVHGDHFAGVSSAPIGRHRSQLSGEEVRQIEHELAPAFERFGWRPTFHERNDRV